MEIVGNFDNALNMMTANTDSCLFENCKEHHIKLEPKYQGNMKSGITCHLTCFLSRYYKEFEGVPVAFRNIKVKQRMGKIIADQACIHFDVVADFIVFKPTLGCTVTGKVNKVTKKHIGCLVHNCFNAWMIQSCKTENLAIDKLMGSNVQFEVEAINTQDNVLSMKGKFIQLMPKLSLFMDDTELVDMTKSPSKSKKRKKGKQAEHTDEASSTPNSQTEPANTEAPDTPTEANIEDGDPASEKRKKKPKKHKHDKKKHEESTDVAAQEPVETEHTVQVSGTDTADTSINMTSEGKAHKKKKKKDKDREKTSHDSSAPVTNGNTSEIVNNVHKDAESTKKDKSRKRKLTGDFSDTSRVDSGEKYETQSVEESLFSPKKKRKHDKVASDIVIETVDNSVDSDTKHSKKKSKKKKHKSSE